MISSAGGSEKRAIGLEMVGVVRSVMLPLRFRAEVVGNAASWLAMTTANVFVLAEVAER